ncbi:hypothetical protein DW150_18675 [Phocaeicola vulgatus]|uniref:Uncharacterized protein n=1 Tax=Phocaeicola vulgatus TaxID=821 RepID=A0A415BJJ3_PHOVU|nr:hypothetical protein DW150_18675 [Phocaeicola vulgatus]
MDPSQKFVYLHCVFHSIRFKVNKRLAVWEDSLFYFILVSPPKKVSLLKMRQNEKGKNQSKIACKNIGNAKVCFFPASENMFVHVHSHIVIHTYRLVRTYV